MSDTVTCPQCQANIEVTEVMSAQLAASIRQDLQAEFAENQTDNRSRRRRSMRLERESEALPAASH